MFAKIFLNTACQTKPQPYNAFFSNISAQGGLFFKPFLVFSIVKGTNGVEKSENVVHQPQKLPQKAIVAGKLDLIGKNGFLFMHLIE